jgi:hypothetical protein
LDAASFIPGTGTSAKRANEFSLNLATLGVSVDPASGLRDPDDGHDTAAHEFAHVLDQADGARVLALPHHRGEAPRVRRVQRTSRSPNGVSAFASD